MYNMWSLWLVKQLIKKQNKYKKNPVENTRTIDSKYCNKPENQKSCLDITQFRDCKDNCEVTLHADPVRTTQGPCGVKSMLKVFDRGRNDMSFF